MVDGFWTVRFEGVQGAGGGVAVFTKGRIFGGDSAYTYTGSYEGDNQIRARVSVQNFIPGVPNVLGQTANFDLEFTGTVTGNTIRVVANLAGQPGARLNAQLTGKSDVP